MTVFLRLAALAATAIVPLSGALASEPGTTTPIKHVIVVIGENVSFDTLFATYTPKAGQTVKNLLSQGIVKTDGTPGKSFNLARQNIGALPRSKPPGSMVKYSINPTRVGPYATLPQPLMIGVLDPTDFSFAPGVPDPRYSSTMPAGPYQITNGQVHYSGTYQNEFSYETGDPVHRFYQMWQQTAGANILHDMFVWPAVTVGTGGSSGGPTPQNAEQGGELMGFFNMAQGDAPYFKSLADSYTLADNYHQAVMGGTGMNFFAIATGDLPVYTRNGLLAVPPTNQIENPDPQSGTANFYKEDGYSGGSYSNCSDSNQPGVASILTYLKSIGRASNCQKNAYYLLNNYNMPFDIYGRPTLDANNNPISYTGETNTKFTLPAQSVPTIGDALNLKGVSWKWYTGGRDDADVTSDPLYPALVNAYGPYAVAVGKTAFYNNIGDPINASVNRALTANLQGLSTFYNDVSNSTLPAVSFVVPKNLDSGHPGYSVSAKYEAFVQDLITKVQGQPDWANTAIVITTDEGGGYFDTGANQTLDFFGDGSRIPMVLVSPYAKAGVVDHTYYDHVSVLKFIERNWNVSPLSSRSRDRLPNPKHAPNSYLPNNQPAIGDLMNMFSFTR